MEVTAVFLDTAALLAIMNQRDGLHDRAMAVHKQLTAERTPMVTSQWVLTEFLGGASRVELRSAAAATIDRITSSPRARVIPCSDDMWRRGFELFRGRVDKEWSLVDCISMLMCHELGVSRAFTSDHHFIQAGFEILMA